VTMISHSVEISIAGGVVAMVRGLPLSLFFSSFFFNHAWFVSRYKKPYAALAIRRKKPMNAKPPPASPLQVKDQTPRIQRKNPRLAPKIIYPRHLRRQFIETYRRETQTLPQAPQNKRNDGSAKALSGPEGEDG